MRLYTRLGGITLILLFLFVILKFSKVKRLYRVMNFFDKEMIHDNFYEPTAFFPAHTIQKSSTPYQFTKGTQVTLPNFSYKGKLHTAENYIDSAFVNGLVITKNDQLIFEKYYNDNSENTTHISWSVAKSFVSVLLGIAIEEGYIKSINETVEQYLPQLKGSGYEGVKIVDVLQMSSGVGFNEDYGDFWSDINRWSRGFALGESQDAFAASLKRMLVVQTTGKTLSDYMQKKLWEPLGAEFEAQWICDDEDMEIAFGGLNVALRDYLKFGLMVCNDGLFNGNQIVSKKWLEESRRVEKEHLRKIADGGTTDYGYQWWLPVGDGSEVVARGHSGQYIYINLKSKTVVAQNSANIYNNDKKYLYSNFPVILAFFRAINQHLDTSDNPQLNDTVRIIECFEKAGVDMVEIGMPFSDPLADGPIIQMSNSVALQNGINIPVILEQLQNIRQSVQIPLVLMGYLNPILQYGIENFCKQCKTIGIDGVFTSSNINLFLNLIN